MFGLKNERDMLYENIDEMTGEEMDAMVMYEEEGMKRRTMIDGMKGIEMNETGDGEEDAKKKAMIDEKTVVEILVEVEVDAKIEEEKAVIERGHGHPPLPEVDRGRLREIHIVEHPIAVEGVVEVLLYHLLGRDVAGGFRERRFVDELWKA